MSTDPEGSPPGRDPLDDLAESYLSARRRGEEPSIESLAQDHPEMAERILELFPMLEMLEKAGEQIAPTADGELELRELGEFQIVRRIGRGGMGVVYEAIQRSLERRVALKVLPGHARLDPRQKQRFQREARAAARLRHPNIVPVFEVGELDEIHYYAMQLIEGKGLDRVLLEMHSWFRGESSEIDSDLASWILGTDRESSPAGGETDAARSDPGRESDPGSREAISLRYFRRIARIGIQVARALSYAHAEGVLHRDLKPSNLLLDRSGTAWITDFGLAKAEDSEAITVSGDILGTPRYMAPESLQGWADPRTDIWGLGVTMYELLTLQPPFAGENRVELLRRIAEEEPTPPRRLDRRIPADLETVVLTAIEKEPARRFASAADMADDLERFLEGRPIHARRSTWLHHFGLFLKRHRLVVSVAAAALVLLVVTETAWAFMLRGARDRESRARQDLERSLERERETGMRSEDNFQLALRAVKRMQDRLGAERLELSKRPERLRCEVLQDAVEFYCDFLKRRSSDPAIRLDAAAAWSHLGRSQSALGLLDEAERSLHSAERLLRELVSEEECAALRVQLASVLSWICRCLHNQRRFEEAKPIADEVTALVSELVELPPSDSAHAAGLLASLEFVARSIHGSTHHEQALALLDRGIGLGMSFLEEHQGNDDPNAYLRNQLRSCLTWRGNICTELGRYGEAMDHLRRALQVIAPLEGIPAYASLHEAGTASASRYLAEVHLNLHRYAEAGEHGSRAIELGERLVEEYPGTESHKLELASALACMGRVHTQTGDFAKAETLLQRAVDDHLELIQKPEPHPERVRRYARALNSLAELREAQGRMEDARSGYEDAIEKLERLCSMAPSSRPHGAAISSLAMVCNNLGRLMAATASPSEAEPWLRRSSELSHEALRQSPDSLEEAQNLIDVETHLGFILHDTRCPEEAEELLRGCLEFAGMAVSRHPESTLLLSQLQVVHLALSRPLIALDHLDEAEDHLLEAVALAEEVVKRGGDDPRYRTNLGSALRKLGQLLMMTRRYEEAQGIYDRAVELLSGMLEKAADRSKLNASIASDLLSAGYCAIQLGRPEECAASARRAAQHASEDPRVLYFAASHLCRCAAASEPDHAGRFADEAMLMLRRAVAKGFREENRLRGDPSLGPLRRRDDFRQLLEELER